MGKRKKKADTAKVKKKGSQPGGKVSKVTNLRQAASGAPATIRGQGINAWFDQVQTFLREVRIEFSKTTWSNKKETIAMTSAVLALTMFFTAYLGLVDIILSKVVGFLIY